MVAANGTGESAQTPAPPRFCQGRWCILAGNAKSSNALRISCVIEALCDYAFRGAPFFETDAPQYEWLNRIVTVAAYRFEPDRVILSVYAIH